MASLRHLLAGAAVLVSVAAASAAHAQCGIPADMTGTWRADDGGTYYVREVGADIWWYGMSKDNGLTWSNVFKGERQGQQVVGTWADVPRGGMRSSGFLNLVVATGGGGVLGWRKTTVTGGFSGSSWFIPCGDSQLVPGH